MAADAPTECAVMFPRPRFAQYSDASVPTANVGAHEDAAADEVAAHGADEAQHHHVGEEVLVLDVAEDVEDALHGARVAGDMHEVACHQGPEGHDAPSYRHDTVCEH